MYTYIHVYTYMYMIPVCVKRQNTPPEKNVLRRAFTAPNQGKDRCFLLLDRRARAGTKGVLFSQTPVWGPHRTPPPPPSDVC